MATHKSLFLPLYRQYVPSTTTSTRTVFSRLLFVYFHHNFLLSSPLFASAAAQTCGRQFGDYRLSQSGSSTCRGCGVMVFQDTAAARAGGRHRRYPREECKRISQIYHTQLGVELGAIGVWTSGGALESYGGARGCHLSLGNSSIGGEFQFNPNPGGRCQFDHALVCKFQNVGGGAVAWVEGQDHPDDGGPQAAGCPATTMRTYREEDDLRSKGGGTCRDEWCDSPGLGGTRDCMAGSDVEPCDCKEGAARMVGTQVEHEGKTYYGYTCGVDTEENIQGRECGDFNETRVVILSIILGILVPMLCCCCWISACCYCYKKNQENAAQAARARQQSQQQMQMQPMGQQQQAQAGQPQVIYVVQQPGAQPIGAPAGGQPQPVYVQSVAPGPALPAGNVVRPVVVTPGQDPL